MSRSGEAAALLWEQWSTGGTIQALPPRCRPATVEEGWAIQRALDEHAGEPVGWKIAATGPAGQAHIRSDGPLAGRLYERCLVESGAQLDAEAMNMPGAEAEFAFRMTYDVDGPPSRDKVLAAVGAFLPAIEVPDSRFDDFLAAGLPSMVADAMMAAFLVLGPETTAWRADELPTLRVAMQRNGEVIGTGVGADVLGDPIDALVWVARHLHERGLALRAGDIVTTGACTPVNEIASGDELAADFGQLGQVRVRFAAA